MPERFGQELLEPELLGPKRLVPEHSASERCVVLFAGLPGALANEVGAARPGWTVLSLDADDPSGQPFALRATARPDRVFAFVGWLLPAMSGLEMCRRLRDRPATASAHITMVLDTDDQSARRRALAAGVDDYTLAPLDPHGVIARIEDLAHARGPAEAEPMVTGFNAAGMARAPGQALVHRGLEVDPAAFMVRHAGRIVRLRRNEFDILVHFMRRPNQVLSREALVEQIGKGGMIGERTVDRRIARLRKTLCDQGIEDPIRTVYGVGYVFDTVD